MSDRMNVVYYIGNGTSLKIGTTVDLDRRYWELQKERPSVPLEIVAWEEGSYVLEKRRHQMFADCRLSGEWFSMTPRLEYHTQQVRSVYAPHPILALPPVDTWPWDWSNDEWEAVRSLGYMPPFPDVSTLTYAEAERVIARGEAFHFHLFPDHAHV